MQADLFNDSTESAAIQVIQSPEARVSYIPAFISADEASNIMQTLSATLAWRQDDIKLFGKAVKIPRLQAYYGDNQAQYRYSGLDMRPLPWTPLLRDLKQRCERYCGESFNAVLANLYRNERDSMGMHADNEPELGDEPVIASLSFGAERQFDLRHNSRRETHRLPLQHGSLLIMAGATQEYWQHGISKRQKAFGPRINLTFRRIHAGVSA